MYLRSIGGNISKKNLKIIGYLIGTYQEVLDAHQIFVGPRYFSIFEVSAH